MTKFYLRSGGFALLFLTFLCTCVRAQTTLVQQDFEGAATDDWNYTVNPPSFDNADLWAITTSVGGGGNAITTAASGSNFWGMLDLNNGNGGTAGELLMTFDAVTVTGNSNVVVEFFYNEFGFDGANGDYLEYEVLIDGTSGGRVRLTGSPTTTEPTGWISVQTAIPDGTNTVQLILVAKQNGNGDWAGWDNASVQFNNATDPCGITGFGPATAVCLSESTASGVDLFQIAIPYQGVDDDAVLLVEAGATTPASDVTASTTNAGDDFQTVADGTILLENSAGEFEEGDEVRITLTDAGGDCSFIVEVSTTENQCSNPCDPNINPDNITFTCEANTAGNDPGRAFIPFTNGPEPGATVTVNPAVTVSGDDIATAGSGDIILEGITEGTTYTVTIEGGGCTGTEVLTVTADFATGTCIASDLVINEINYDPFVSSAAGYEEARDANKDGVVDGSSDEFVEFYNTGATELDLSGYTVAEGSGVFFTFPAGTIIPAESGFVIFAVAPSVDLGCPTFGSQNDFGGAGVIGLNNGGDVVTVRDASDNVVASYTYTGTGSGDNQSLARDPDFTGPFVGHESITTNPVPQSACEFNTMPAVALPVTLQRLTATTRGKLVSVEWATSYERANDYFVVERSADGRRWTDRGRVPANATGEYTFTDGEVPTGLQYYRLRQVDLDGTTTHHGPVTVTLTGGRLAVYPNPVVDELYLSAVPDGATEISLLDANGRALRSVTPRNGRVDVRDLKTGLYLLRVRERETVTVLRFVKQ